MPKKGARQTLWILLRLVGLQCYDSRMRLSITLLLSSCLLQAAGNPSGAVKFQTHVVEAEIPGGYAVLAIDMNKDGRPDVIGMTSRIKELAWYENPSWERHVMIQDMNGLINMAAHDIDGDGIPELSIENEFSMGAANSRGLGVCPTEIRHEGNTGARLDF